MINKEKKESKFMSGIKNSRASQKESKNLKISYICQRVFSVLFILNVIVVCLYTLWFMTDFMGMRGFVFKGKVASDFYDKLQPFNQRMFYFALLGVISIIFVKVFDFTKNVVDYAGLIIMSIISIILIYSSIDAMSWFPAYKAEYLKVLTPEVLASMKIENTADYIIKTRAFSYGNIVYLVNIFICVFFVAVSWTTNILFAKNNKNTEVKQSEVTVDEQSI